MRITGETIRLFVRASRSTVRDRMRDKQVETFQKQALAE
jgi:hypothetical protein